MSPERTDKQPPVRACLFGGSFNPPHLGHLGVARTARDRGSFESVIFLPSAQPPHKDAGGMPTFAHRCEMVRLAVAGEPAFQVSDLEGERTGPSYTVDTLRAFRTRLGEDCELHMLIGADSVWELGTWHEARALFSLARFVVAARPGFDLPQAGVIPPGLSADQMKAIREGILLTTDWEVSSREIRERIARGRPVGDLVPGAVEAFIRKRGLYLS